MNVRSFRNPSNLLAVSVMGAILAGIFIFYAYQGRSSASLYELKTANTKIVTFDVDPAKVMFAIDNFSNRPAIVSQIESSCKCMIFEASSRLPLKVGAQSSLDLVGTITNSPTLAPVNIMVRARLECEGKASDVYASVSYFCKPKYRLVPGVVTFGEVSSTAGVPLREAELYRAGEFQSEDCPKIRTRVEDNGFAVLGVEVRRKKSAIPGLEYLATISVACKPENIRGVMRGKIHIDIGTERTISIPLAAISE